MKKGFTLIELLAVILILGIIALIAIPTVNDIIQSSKQNSFKVSIKNVMDETERQCQIDKIKGTAHVSAYKFSETAIVPALSIKGELPTGGYINVSDDCAASFSTLRGKSYCAFWQDDDYTIDNCDDIYDVNLIDFSDFTNWESGSYNYTTGRKETTSVRIRLNDYITINPNQTYLISISDTNYKILFREMDKELNFIRTMEIRDGGTYQPDEGTKYVGIIIYRPSGTTMTYLLYKELFEGGFTVSIVKQ